MRLNDLTVHVLEGFDDPLISPERWAAALHTGSTDVVFLTWHWQRAWWDTFARGRLLLIAVERIGEIVALAPLFADEGMIYFVGSGGSDYLDFIGDITEPEILDLILHTARESVPGFLGFRFYHVPDESRTGALLRAATARLNFEYFDQGELAAPALDFTVRKNGSRVTEKNSLLRHEKFFRRDRLGSPLRGGLGRDLLRRRHRVLPFIGGFGRSGSVAAAPASSGHGELSSRCCDRDSRRVTRRPRPPCRSAGGCSPT